MGYNPLPNHDIPFSKQPSGGGIHSKPISCLQCTARIRLSIMSSSSVSVSSHLSGQNISASSLKTLFDLWKTKGDVPTLMPPGRRSTGLDNELVGVFPHLITNPFEPLGMTHLNLPVPLGLMTSEYLPQKQIVTSVDHVLRSSYVSLKLITQIPSIVSAGIELVPHINSFLLPRYGYGILWEQIITSSMYLGILSLGYQLTHSYRFSLQFSSVSIKCPSR